MCQSRNCISFDDYSYFIRQVEVTTPDIKCSQNYSSWPRSSLLSLVRTYLCFLPPTPTSRTLVRNPPRPSSFITTLLLPCNIVNKKTGVKNGEWGYLKDSWYSAPGPVTFEMTLFPMPAISETVWFLTSSNLWVNKQFEWGCRVTQTLLGRNTLLWFPVMCLWWEPGIECM